MSEFEINLPPLFTALGFSPDADLPAEVLFRAQRGRIDAGTVCYSERPDRLDVIFMLAPETPLSHAMQVIYPMMLSANDALGASIPPVIAVHLGWPDRIFVNGALAGGVALFTETSDLDAVPDWLMARVVIDIMGSPSDAAPGETPDQTSLYQEGAGEVSARTLLESYCRYMLNWLDRWQRSGTAALAPLWLERAAGREKEAVFPDGNALARGTVSSLTDKGDLVIDTSEGQRTLSLADLLQGPSWEI